MEILTPGDTGPVSTPLWLIKKQVLLPTQAASTVSTGLHQCAFLGVFLSDFWGLRS